jgi:hypothetical protein
MLLMLLYISGEENISKDSYHVIAIIPVVGSVITLGVKAAFERP